MGGILIAYFNLESLQDYVFIYNPMICFDISYLQKNMTAVVDF